MVGALLGAFLPLPDTACFWLLLLVLLVGVLYELAVNRTRGTDPVRDWRRVFKINKQKGVHHYPLSRGKKRWSSALVVSAIQYI